MAEIDPDRIPVIAGAACIGNPSERIVGPEDLAGIVIRAALDDAELRQGDLDALWAIAPSEHDGPLFAGRIGEAIGLEHSRCLAGPWSGIGPQSALGEICDGIAAGAFSSAVLVGSVADGSIRRAHKLGQAPLSQPAIWFRDATGNTPPRAQRPVADRAAGIDRPVTMFALIDSVLAADRHRTPLEQRRALGQLMSGFSEVAAARPQVAAFPVSRSAEEIWEVTEENRMIATPYTKRMTAFPDVDVAAALVVVSLGRARALGLPMEQLVFPHSSATCEDPLPPSVRPSIGWSDAIATVVGRACGAAGLHPVEMARFDLYSCFPAAVQLACRGLAIGEDDPRPLTVTGGLPFYGGPGASYGVHALAWMVKECRTAAGEPGLVFSVGGYPTDFAATVLSSAEPSAPWSRDDGADQRDRLARLEVPLDLGRSAVATVEASTVVHDRVVGPVGCPVLARFADGKRTAARPADSRFAADVGDSAMVGREVMITASGDGLPLYELV